MEKDARATTMSRDPKQPRKLNLNTPLLSTRRPYGATSLELCRANPKGGSSDNRVPFSWEQTAGKPKNIKTNDSTPAQLPRPPPGKKLLENAFDGDDDDTFSLSAAMDDMVESAENKLGDVSLNRGNQSPSFIIQRFLSDAKALAVTSGFRIPKNISNQKCLSRTISPKGCGLDRLFCWGAKHKPPCGVKSPVRVTSASVRTEWGMKHKHKKKQKSS